MSGVVRAVGRVLPQPRARALTDGYAFCSEDGFWFRPAYTEGKCPLCGEAAPGGFARMERSWLGTAGLALVSLAMLAVVLFMYFS